MQPIAKLLSTLVIIIAAIVTYTVSSNAAKPARYGVLNVFFDKFKITAGVSRDIVAPKMSLSQLAKFFFQSL